MVEPIFNRLVIGTETRISVRTASDVLPAKPLEKALNSISFIRCGIADVECENNWHDRPFENNQTKSTLTEIYSNVPRRIKAGSWSTKE